MTRRDRPRVLFACDYHLKYAAWLARGLVDAGAHVRLLTRDHGGEFGGDRAELERGLAERLDGAVPAWLLPGRARDAAALQALPGLVRRRRAFGADVVHLQEGLLNDPRLAAVVVPRPGGYALTVHDPTLHPGDRPVARLRERAERLLQRRAGLIFVHGEALRDELREVLGARSPAIEVVPHGAAAPDVRPLPGTPSLLFFGRMSRYKGLDVLLDAMPAVWAREPRARLVVAGEGELPPHDALDDARVDVRSEHVREDALPDLFAAATCVMLPYVQASQSGVGSRAKSFGRAMVVTDVGGLPELVADGSGLVVAPGDAGALAEAALALLSDPARAARMGEAGAATLERESSWERVAERTLEAYCRHGLLEG